MKHTQGKWFVSMQGVTEDTNERKVLIAFEEGVTLANAVDDKNLIESAPDLLKACKQSLNLLCTGYENGIAEIKIDDAGPLISALKNAIERAEVESNG